MRTIPYNRGVEDPIDSAAASTIGDRYRQAAQNLARGEMLRLTVTGGSMEPLLRAGDVVLAQPVGDRLPQPGDIIVTQWGTAWVTHRVLRMAASGCITHGDNSCLLDEPVAIANVIGRVIAIERDNRRVDVRSAWWQRAGRFLAWSARGKLGLLGLGRGGKVASTPGTAEAAALGFDRYLTAPVVWPFQMLNRVIVWIMLKFN